MRSEARQGKLIAVANMKGGVGKTTTVVSLAEFLALQKHLSVLVIDLDPQASASICIAGDEILADLIQHGRTLEAFLAVQLLQKKETSLEKRIRRACCTVTKGGEPISLNLIPTGPELRMVERQLLHSLVKREFDMSAIDDQLSILFKEHVAPLRAQFDFIIFDCAPGISPFTEVAIKSSDLVIVPSIPDRLSTYGLGGFCALIEGFELRKRLEIRPLFTRVQSNVRQHQRVMRDIENSDLKPFKVRIPQNATLANALISDEDDAFHVPTLSQKYGATMIAILQAFTAEVRSTLDGR